jgi:hypothetical protein
MRLGSGIDELLNELGARRLDSVSSATIVLPASELEPGREQQLRGAITAYCELRLRETNNELLAFRHDAWGALGVGMILFVVGLVVSTIVTESSVPKLVKVLGDGLAVVVSWIGAWYPIDTLIHYTRPYRRARKVLQALSRLQIVVEPRADEPAIPRNAATATGNPGGE